MKTRPEGAGPLVLLGSAMFMLVMAVAGVGCAGKLKNPAPKDQPKDPLSSSARAFLQARSQAWVADGTPKDGPTEPAETNVAPQQETIEIIGGVERPGQLVLGTYAQTVRQALDAMGGSTHPKGSLRIRPGGDASPRLFAEAQGTDLIIEIPLSVLDDLAPIYVRPGDIIEVIPNEIGHAADSRPVASLDASAALPASATEPSERVIVTERSVTPPPQATVEETTSPVEPSPEAQTLPAPAAGEASDKDVAALRRDVDSQLAALRNAVQRLQEENARLRARVELPTRTGSLAPAVSPGIKPPPPASDVTSASRLPQAEPRPAITAKPPQKAELAPAAASAQPARTVQVSGSVKSPGTYPIAAVKTVLGAVRAAGNRGDANLAAVEIRPEAQSGALVGIGLGLGASPARTIVDLSAVENGKGRDIPLRGGEVIFVPPSRRPEPRR